MNKRMWMWVVGAMAVVMGMVSACGPAAPGSDIYRGAGVSEATANAAQATMIWFGQQITATAEARAGTATQQAWEAAQQQTRVAQTATREVWQVTATAASAASTSTAEATGTMAARTQQALDLEQTAAVAVVQNQRTQQAIVVASHELALKREEMMNQVRAVAPWVGMGLVFALLIFLGVVLGWAQSKRPVVVQRDARGDAPILVSGNNIYDADRNPQPVFVSGKAPQIPQLTSEIEQHEVTRRDQMLDAMHRGLPGQGQTLRPRAWKLGDEVGRAQEEEVGRVQVLPAVAPWERMLHWPGGELCLGAGEGGEAIRLNPEKYPQLYAVGTSGSGKSRGGLRPLAAEALADGWQVVILDRTGVDYGVFSEHPNARLVTLGGRPEDAVGYMHAVYEEVVRRCQMLFAVGCTTWGRWLGRPAPRVLVVVDEFSNLADSIADGGREQLMAETHKVVSEGRKAGVHLLLALQDPTRRSIDVRIKRNMTPICFQVRDEVASRLVLGASGAQDLAQGHFLTLMGGMVRGAAFMPSDDEIRQFLRQRPMDAQAGSPRWLQLAETTGEGDVERRVRALAADKVSMNEIQRQVFGFVGGSAYARVRKILASTTEEQGLDASSTGVVAE